MQSLPKPFIILASGSPRRAALLKAAGFAFEILPSQAEEKQASHDDVHQVVEENACIKGEDVVAKLRASGREFTHETLLLAADTLVVMKQKVYGKPKDLRQAETFLHELGGKAHQVLTGVYLYHFQTRRAHHFHEVTKVVLKTLTAAQMRTLFQRVNPLDKAAAYGYQDAPEIVERLQGSSSNVIGLPMERLQQELVAFMAPA